MWQPITDPKQIQRAMAGYPCWLEMDLDNLRFNLANIRSRVGVEVMPVVKNNAYGHGLVPVTRCLYDEGVRWFLVAKLYEADVIRQQFPESKVLCMDTLFGDTAYDLVVSRGISQAVFTLDMAQRLNDTAQRHNTQASVFIKVDTGLRRVGVHHETAPDFVEAVCKLPHIKLEGLFSSFMQHPDEDQNMLLRFNEVASEVERRGIEVPLRSMASTNAIFHQPEAWLDIVRPAMCLYGVHPFPNDHNVDLELKQVLELKCRIEFVKDIQAGDSVTYFGTFVAEHPMRIGTMHMGFFDAIPRELANKLRIKVEDRYCPGIGTIALNHSLLDLTDTAVEIGDTVTVISRDGENNLYEVATAAGWMVYSVMNHLNSWLPRLYLENGEPTALLDPVKFGSP